VKSVIVGTAGHVDHGKTVLVEALTGVNTDRWDEERERGITIDLGFAPFPSQIDGLEVSVIDVPGHEDFVKNMLAGATGVDVLLLVVAADEGPMPQTREHLWIARLLGVETGVVAITKSDLVDDDFLSLVAESVRDELTKIFPTGDWPVVPVSARLGDGIDELKTTVLDAASRTRARRDDDLFRMPVDRAFSIRGVGTVVTGTVWSGAVEAGEEVQILPAGRAARVRGVQVHGVTAQRAGAGQRAALALVGIDVSEIGRGETLTRNGPWRETRVLDAELLLLADSPWPLKYWQRVRFHIGTAETMGRVVLFDRNRLEPGDRALVQFRLEQPVVARAGDRFVVRFYSPVTTVGGGVVVHPWATRHAHIGEDAIRRLRSVAESDGKDRLVLVMSELREGASESQLAILVGTPPSDLGRDLAELASEGRLRQIGGRWYDAAAVSEARRALTAEISRSHAENADAPGASLESLRSAVGAPPGLVNAVLSDLQQDGEIRIQGSVAALSSHVPSLSAEQEAVAASALARIAEAGLAPPSVKELAGAAGVPADRLLAVLKFLCGRGELVAVTPDLYYASGAITEVKQRVKATLSQGQAATPSELRSALGISRKYLIPLLEYLDAEGFTRRSGEGRVLREEP
jgi:selenocysteine-specific elongation factor